MLDCAFYIKWACDDINKAIASLELVAKESGNHSEELQTVLTNLHLARNVLLNPNNPLF